METILERASQALFVWALAALIVGLLLSGLINEGRYQYRAKMCYTWTVAFAWAGTIAYVLK